MSKTKVPFLKVLNSAFDDTLDHWFLCVPAATCVLIGTLVVPNAGRAIGLLRLGTYKAQIAGGLVFVVVVINVLLNVFANFITVTAWLERERGRDALRRGYDALRDNLWRCAWTYTVWFLLYLAYVVGAYLVAIGGLSVVFLLKPPVLVALVAYVSLGGGTLYLVWRLIRHLVAVQYLPAVLAVTPGVGRRAIDGAIGAMRKRFWLSLVLPLVTFAPGLIPNVIAMKADWRLHSFISCILGGFFATFGTLVTLYVYRWPRAVPAERPREAERVSVPALVEA
jgi:hypothetical protein